MKKLVFAVMALSAASVSFAGETRVVIDVPKTEVATASLADVRTHKSLDLEVATSTWAPQNFENYRSVGLPYLSVSGMREFYRENADALSLKLGGAFYQLGRTVNVDYGGGPVTVDQHNDLISARIGLEYQHTVTQSLSPYLSVALLPTYSIVPRTAAAESRGEFGVPLEAGFGVMTGLHGIGLDRMKLNLGAIITSGNIDSTAFYGIGALAGLRVSL